MSHQKSCRDMKCFMGKICVECIKTSHTEEEDYEEEEEEPTVYKDNMCMFNVAYNKIHAFKNYDLRIVGGGLGIDGWFEYGGRNWSHKKYLQKPNDIHFWLEDKQGRVYDFIQPSWNEVARIRGLYDKFENVELRGVSKEEIKSKYKIEYVATREKTWKECYDAVMRWM